MAIFNFIKRKEPDIEGIKARLLGMLGPEMLTQQQAGPLLPGQERQDITAAQQGTGVFQPKIAELLSGLIASPETRGVGSNLLQGALGQKFGLGGGDDRTNLMKNFAFLEILKQTNPEQAAIFEKILLKPQVAINQGDKPLSVDELLKVRGPKGEKLPFGITSKQAQEIGATVQPVPTSEEARKMGLTDIALRDLNTLESLVDNNKFDPSVKFSTELKAGTGPLGELGRVVANYSGIGELTNDEATAVSIIESLSNQLLAAFRGANVGPEEQKKFERQLPILGQDKKLFIQNIKATKANLDLLKKRAEQARGTIGTNQAVVVPPPPPGFVED